MKKKYPIKTKYGVFDAIIWLDKREDRYFVTIPAFPGVMTEARSLVEAKKYAGEVLSLECMEALEQGKLVVDNTKRIYGTSVRAGALSVA